MIFITSQMFSKIKVYFLIIFADYFRDSGICDENNVIDKTGCGFDVLTLALPYASYATGASYAAYAAVLSRDSEIRDSIYLHVVRA